MRYTTLSSLSRSQRSGIRNTTRLRWAHVLAQWRADLPPRLTSAAWTHHRPAFVVRRLRGAVLTMFARR